MKIKEQLNELVDYYENTRQVGHTQLIMNGLLRTPSARVLVHNMQQAVDMVPTNPTDVVNSQRFVTLGGLRRLSGQNTPLAIDNCAQWVILRSALEEIERLEGLVEALSKPKS